MMVKILKKFGARNRMDIASFFGVAFIFMFLIIVKIAPHHFGIDWAKNKIHKHFHHKNVDITKDHLGNSLSKQEGKEKYFKLLNKTNEQIAIDKFATYYLRGAWIVPQFLPQIFNFTYVGGLYNVSLASTYAITHILKNTVKKQRPDKGNFRSFPSGHTSGTFVLGGFLHRYVSLKVAAPFYILGAIIGGSRIYCHRHDIYDVVAGAIIGFISGFYANAIALRFIKYIVARNTRARKIQDYLLEPLK